MNDYTSINPNIPIRSLFCHQFLDIFPLSRKVTQHFWAIFADHHIIFQPHSSHFHVLVYLLFVQVFLRLWVLQMLLDDEVDEVAAWLHSDAHPFLHVSRSSQRFQSCFFTPCWPLGISSDIMNSQPKHVPQTMGEEYCSDSLFNELLHWEFIDNPNSNQVLQNDLLCQ